jgi:hypothetical protein
MTSDYCKYLCNENIDYMYMKLTLYFYILISTHLLNQVFLAIINRSLCSTVATRIGFETEDTNEGPPEVSGKQNEVAELKVLQTSEPSLVIEP